MSHTPGPLDIKPYVDAIDLVAPDGTVVAHMADRDIRLEGMPPDNARRIRDCWNACEGLTDKQVNAIHYLESVAKGVLVALRYPRGSEAQVRCLEEVGQDAKYALAKAEGDSR